MNLCVQRVSVSNRKHKKKEPKGDLGFRKKKNKIRVSRLKERQKIELVDSHTRQARRVSRAVCQYIN